MTVQLYNWFYFMYIIFAIGSFVGLYFLLRKKSEKIKTIVVGAILVFNLVLHFLKLTFPPYSTNPDLAMSQIWFINICGVSILIFPIIFFSKNKTLKDFMLYLGVISGFLALVYPTEAINKDPFALDTIRFYLAHSIIIIAPLLMVSLKLHTISYRRIWAMPLIICAYLLFIMVQNVLQSELGIINLRNGDFFNPNYHNPSLVWGPTDGVAIVFKIFTPGFMKVVPYGPYQGELKFWPFFWLVPGAFVYFWAIPFVFVLIIKNSRIELFEDIKKIIHKIKNRRKTA